MEVGRIKKHDPPTWNPKQPETNGCSNMAIEILYMFGETSISFWLFRVPPSSRTVKPSKRMLRPEFDPSRIRATWRLGSWGKFIDLSLPSHPVKPLPVSSPAGSSRFRERVGVGLHRSPNAAGPRVAAGPRTELPRTFQAFRWF